MKRIIFLIVVTLLLLSLCSCSEKCIENDMQTNASQPDNQPTLNNDETTPTENSSIPEISFIPVEITLDNYEEYFEFRDNFYACKDEFGDYIDCMHYGVYLCLKDKYEADTSYGTSEVKIKFQHTNSWYGFDFNEESGEGKLLECYDAFNDVYTTKVYFEDYSYTEGYDNITFAAEIFDETVHAWPYSDGGWDEKYQYAVYCYDNINITGIIGTLYVREK